MNIILRETYFFIGYFTVIVLLFGVATFIVRSVIDIITNQSRPDEQREIILFGNLLVLANLLVLSALGWLIYAVIYYGPFSIALTIDAIK